MFEYSDYDNCMLQCVPLKWFGSTVCGINSLDVQCHIQLIRTLFEARPVYIDTIGWIKDK